MDTGARDPIGLIVVDHGSRRAESNEMLEEMVAMVARVVPYEIVEPAHMELAEPTIAQGFEACVRAGADEVIAFPYMLSPGKHSTRDIPRLVAEAAARFPTVRFSVTPAFGVHEKLAQVVLERAGVVPTGNAAYVTT